MVLTWTAAENTPDKHAARRTTPLEVDDEKVPVATVYGLTMLASKKTEVLLHEAKLPE